MTSRQTETKITALYERLSNDDRLLGDSNSIVNQKAMLESYAKQNNFSNLQHYTDDGFSGGNFERPSWKRMVSDIQAGKVGTVIVKDMSRVGRDYLQTGFYTEVLFKQQGVRFIAVSNGVDSTDASSSEFAPFLNIMNEWYLRDCSRKLKAAYRTKGNSGKPTTSHPPYGYRKSPDDKNQWIVDEESAMVVKRIFNLCVEGYGPGQIAKILMNDKIETPSYYWGKQGISAWESKYDPNRPYDWTSDSVARMLERIEYLGHTVNFKTFRQDYKNNKMLHNPKEKWKIFENTHEPIIDKETWELVQKLRETPKRHDFSDKPNPLTGLLYCADCGAKLYNDSQKAYSQKHGYKPDPMTGYYGSDYYECKNYKLASVRETALCTSHRVNTNALIKLILETIRLVSEYAITNKAEFIEKVKAISLSQHNQDVSEQKETFKAYLMQNESADFVFKNISYHIEIVGVDIFPQGFSAVADRLREFKGVNMLADIGNGTMNVMYINECRPQEKKCFTEKYGTNQCILQIRENIMRQFGTKIDDTVIESFIRTGKADISERYAKVIRETAAEYVKGIFRILREHEYDPELMRLYVVGGGGCMIRNFGEYNPDRVIINSDICATAKGYERLAEIKLRRNGGAV